MLLGAVLPLVIHHSVALDERVGARVSYVYLANVIGSAAGSLATGFVLMDLLSTPAISALLLCLGAIVAAALLALSGRAHVPWFVGGTALLVLLSLAPTLFDKYYERLLFKAHAGKDERFAAMVENRHGVIGVTSGNRVYSGGVYDGAFSVSLVDDINIIERALAVAALRESPRRILVIGLASGSWVQVLAHLPGVEQVRVVEINPGYLELIPRYPAVASILANPKIEIVIDDGRRWLLRHPEARFDAIVMNTTFHWRAHATNLLSREFLSLCRAHLASGGMMLFNTTSSEDVLYTGATEFPYALRVINNLAVSDAPLEFDAARWQAVVRGLRIDGRLALDPAEPGFAEALRRLLSLPGTLALPPIAYGLESRESILARATQARARVITDDNMVSEWRALHLD